MKKYFKVIVLIILTISGLKCVPSKPTYEEQILPADRLVKKLEASRRRIKNFEGSGTIFVESPKLEAKATFEVFLKKPDSLKFIIYGPFGIDLAQALITENEFHFHDMMKNILYKGRNNSHLLQKLFRIDLEFPELIDAFAGAVNLTDKLRKEPNQFNVGDKFYNLSYIDSLNGMRSNYKIQIDNLAIVNYEQIKSPNISLLEGNYSDFEMINGVAIPFEVIIRNIVNKQKVKINYRNIDANKRLKSLMLDLPKDVRVKIL